MNEIVDRIYDEARSAWRFRWLGMIVATALAIAGWVVVFSLPDRYEASASVFVDTQTALRPMLQGLAVDQDVNVQLNYVRQALLSGQRLESIARQSGILPDGETDPKRVAGTLRAFAPKVKLDVRSASNQDQARMAGSIYTFTYQDGDRDRSLKVMDTVVTTFIEETLGGKREGSENSLKFMEQQLKDMQARMAASDNRLAEFKKANVGLLPTDGADYFSQLQQAIDETRRVENELQIATANRAELQRQLRGDAVVGATAVSGGGGGSGPATDTVALINQTQAQIDELLLTYTERWPAVVELRKRLEELKVRRATEVEQLRRGDASAVASSGVSTNPVYQNIRMQLNQAELQVASLRGQLTQYRQKSNDLQRRLDITPKVAAEYAQLTRDDEVIKAQYSAMLSNYEKAQLGEAADDAGSVRFDIVQPVEASYEPVFPPRTLLLSGALLLSLAAGGALAWALQLFRPVITSARSLTSVVDLPVLAVVSAAFPRELSAKLRWELRRFLLAGAALCGAFVVVLLLNWVGLRMPGVG